MKKLISVLLCAVMLVGLIAVGIPPAVATAADSASVTAVSGTVKVKRGTSEKEISAFVGMKVKQDDTITTGAKGGVTIDVGDDKVIKAGANSAFSITTLTETDGTTRVNFTLIKGSVYNSVSKPQKSDDNYTVQAGNTVMGVRGTEFSVYYYVEDGIAKYRVVTLAGTVYTRTLEPKTMTDANNILDIIESLDVAKGESSVGTRTSKPVDLKELSPAELDFIINDENAPEELREAAAEILENIPPVEEEEEPTKKIVYEDKQEAPPVSSTPPLNAAARELIRLFNVAKVSSSSNDWTIYASQLNGNLPVDLSGAIRLDATGMTASTITIVIDVDTKIGRKSTLSVNRPGDEDVQIEVNNSITLTIDGTLTCGTLTNNGTIENNSNTINISGVDTGDEDNVTTVFTNFGTIKNNAGGKITVSGTAGFTNNAGCTINNNGTITLGGMAYFTNDASGTINNVGKIEVNGTAGFANNGEVDNMGTIEAKSLVTDGERFAGISNVGTLTNSGTITVSGITWFNNSNTGTLTNNGGKITVSSTISEEYGLAAFVDNGGEININGGEMSLAGGIVFQGTPAYHTKITVGDGGKFVVAAGSIVELYEKSTLAFVLTSTDARVEINASDVTGDGSGPALASKIIFTNETGATLSDQVVVAIDIFYNDKNPDITTNLPVDGFAGDDEPREFLWSLGASTGPRWIDPSSQG